MMDSGTLSSPTVDAFVRENFIAVRLEKERDEKEFATLDIQEFPCTILMRADRTEVARLPGALDAPTFIEKLRAATAVR